MVHLSHCAGFGHRLNRERCPGLCSGLSDKAHPIHLALFVRWISGRLRADTGKKMSESLKQQVVADARPGGSGIIATEMVARAARRRIHHADGQLSNDGCLTQPCIRNFRTTRWLISHRFPNA